MPTTDLRRPAGAALVVWTALALPAGCQKVPEKVPVHKVTGSVLTADGKPAAGATVAFHPVGREPYPFTPFGTVGRDGAFTPTSYETGDGVPAGDYAVTVVWRSSDPDGEAMGPDKLKGRGYNDPAQTPFKATVTADGAALAPFRLK